jgi:putative ABC transport system ATP-binding protein
LGNYLEFLTSSIRDSQGTWDMNIVECTDIEKTYQQGRIRVRALNGVNLSVDRRGFVALAGPSGSGKTTLLNIMGGLDRADSGTVVFDGDSLREMSQSQLANLRLHKVGFVLQS